MQTSESFNKIAIALAAAQGMFPQIEKNRQANIRSDEGASYSYRYADLAAILAATVPALSKSGIALLQPVEMDENGVTVRTWLIHGESGEWFRSAPMSFAAARDPKQVAGLITYARRYQLSALLAVAADEDVDSGEDETMEVRRAPPAGNGRFVCAHGHKHDSAAEAKSCAGQDQASPPDDTLEPGKDPAAMTTQALDVGALLDQLKAACAKKDWRGGYAIIGQIPRNNPNRKTAEDLYSTARSAK